MARPKRQSIQPTYSRSQTGDRYWVVSDVDGQMTGPRTLLPDPFVRHVVHLHWRDLLCGLLRRKLTVTVTVGGDHDIQEDVLELDDDYLGWNCTRRDEWGAGMRKALVRFGKEQEAAEGDRSASPAGGGE